MEQKLYRLLSYILSPPAIALYVTIVFSLYPLNPDHIDFFSSFTIGSVFLFLIPLISIFHFSRDDFDVTKKEKRNKPFLITIFGYVISSMVFWLLDFHSMFVISMAYVFVSTATFIINIFWKISVHTAGTAGPITAIVYVFGINLVPLYLIVLLTSLIRFKVKAHNLLQIIVGALSAIFITLIVYKVLW